MILVSTLGRLSIRTTDSLFGESDANHAKLHLSLLLDMAHKRSKRGMFRRRQSKISLFKTWTITIDFVTGIGSCEMTVADRSCLDAAFQALYKRIQIS